MFRCLVLAAPEAGDEFPELAELEELEELELQAASMSPAVAMATPRRQWRDRNGMGGTARLLVLFVLMSWCPGVLGVLGVLVSLGSGVLGDRSMMARRFGNRPSGGERGQVRSQGRPVAPLVWASRRCHGPVHR